MLRKIFYYGVFIFLISSFFSREVRGEAGPQTRQELLLAGRQAGLKFSFETNGGRKIGPSWVRPGGRLEKPRDPRRPGYSFRGWYEDRELKKRYGFATRARADMTLYASWERQAGAIDIDFCLYKDGSRLLGLENFCVDRNLNLRKTIERILSSQKEGLSFRSNSQEFTSLEGLENQGDYGWQVYVNSRRLDSLADYRLAQGDRVLMRYDYRPRISKSYLDGNLAKEARLTRAELAKLLRELIIGEDYLGHRGLGLVKGARLAYRQEEPLDYLRRLDLIRGDGSGQLRPDENIKRGELALIIFRLAGLEASEEDAFSDLEDHWARLEINGLARAGLVEGYQETDFRPEEDLTGREFLLVVQALLKKR